MGYSVPAEQCDDFSKSRRLLLAHVAPEDQPRLEVALREFAGGIPVASMDYRIIGDDLVERWIESEWFVELSPDGTPLKGFFTNLDITSRKAAEEQFRRSEESFRQLADSMPQMVWTAAGNGSLNYYNARWHEFTGFGGESYGDIANWEPLLHSDDLRPCLDGWSGSVQSGEPYRIEYRLWDRRARRYCWHLGRALPVRDKDGSIVKWIGTCTDIDEQKRTEEDLRRANLALEQFAFAASHDLQEPLRNIAIYTELFTKTYGASVNEQGNMFLGIILQGAQRMSRLISDLLAYTRVAGPDGEPVTIVDVEKVLGHVLNNLGHAVQENRAAITHDTLPSVSVKDVHLEQLLQNLIGNALKYRKDDEPPQVHVSAQRQDSHWCILVRDNGIGIAPEYKDEIFGVFKRLHAGGDKYSGTGIGLAICHKIVTSYGGRIWVESQPSQGATFHFTLPAALERGP
jgi:PAS domain S-box-containing protein